MKLDIEDCNKELVEKLSIKHPSASVSTDETIRPYLFAFVGVLIFSGTFPATKTALKEMTPLFVFSARTIGASFLALLWLLKREGILEIARSQKKEILISMLGTVVAFPLLTSIALQKTGASHGALVITIVPILTSVVAALVFKTRRSLLFWISAFVGTFAVCATVVIQNQIAWQLADSILFLSALTVSIGYVYGAKVAKTMGGISAISVSLLLAFPIVLPIFLISFPHASVSVSGIFAVGYLAVFSMFVGFIFWYKGLADGHADKVSMVQLLQLFLTFVISHFFLGEAITLTMLFSSLIVVTCLVVSKLAK